MQFPNRYYIIVKRSERGIHLSLIHIFLTRFLENSYAEDGGDRVMKLFVPLLAAASALLGVGYGLLHPDGWWMALTVFVSALCLATPAAMTAMNFPLLRAGKKALSRGGMVSGWNAVKEFGHLHSVVVLSLIHICPLLFYARRQRPVRLFCGKRAPFSGSRFLRRPHGHLGDVFPILFRHMLPPAAGVDALLNRHRVVERLPKPPIVGFFVRDGRDVRLSLIHI